MTNSISSPPPSPVPPTGSLPPIPLTTREGVAVRLLGLPSTLRDTPIPQHVQGEILDAKPDGTLRIRTPSGDITARLPDRVTASPGQTVEIDLPAGSPPSQATLTARAASNGGSPPSTSSSASPQSVETPDPAASVPRAPTTPEPVDNDLRQIAQSRASQTPQSPGSGTLKTDQMVQVQPLSVAQARQAIAAATASMPPQQTSLLSLLQTPISISMPSAGGTLGALLTALTQKALTDPALSTSLLLATEKPLGPSSPLLGASETGLPVLLPTGKGFTPALPLMGQSATLPTTGQPGHLSIFLSGASSFMLETGPTTGRLTPLQARVAEVPLSGLVLLRPIAPLGQIAPLPLPASGIAAPLMVDAPTATLQPFTILGATPQGHLVLQGSPLLTGTPAPLFILQAPAGDTPVGGQLTLTSFSSLPLRPDLSTNLSPLSSIGELLARDLSDLIVLLASTGMTGTGLDASSSALRLSLPQPQSAQQLPAAALFFLAAARSGDLQGWMGERTVDALRRMGKSTLIDQLDTTLGALRRAMGESAANGEWRGVLLPFQFQQDVLPVRLFMKNDRDPENNHPDGGARFILEVDFDRMGAVQLDLLYRAPQLDTILRTELPLSMAMRGALEQKYANAMGKTGCTGALYFQDGLNNWVTVDALTDVMHVLA